LPVITVPVTPPPTPMGSPRIWMPSSVLAEMTLRSRASTAAGFTPMRLPLVTVSCRPRKTPFWLPVPPLPAMFGPRKLPATTLLDDPWMAIPPGKIAPWTLRPRIVLPLLPGCRTSAVCPLAASSTTGA